MKTVSIHEAKTHFSALISTIERTREKIIIMKHNNAVAELVPIPHGDRLTPDPKLKEIEIRYDPIEPTEEEWNEHFDEPSM